MAGNEADKSNASEVSHLRALVGEREAALNRAIADNDTVQIVSAYKALKASREALLKAEATPLLD